VTALSHSCSPECMLPAHQIRMSQSVCGGCAAVGRGAAHLSMWPAGDDTHESDKASYSRDYSKQTNNKHLRDICNMQCRVGARMNAATTQCQATGPVNQAAPTARFARLSVLAQPHEICSCCVDQSWVLYAKSNLRQRPKVVSKIHVPGGTAACFSYARRSVVVRCSRFPITTPTSRSGSSADAHVVDGKLVDAEQAQADEVEQAGRDLRGHHSVKLR
jgi:hypothetical protein